MLPRLFLRPARAARCARGRTRGPSCSPHIPRLRQHVHPARATARSTHELARRLEEEGEGLHHICFGVGDVSAAVSDLSDPAFPQMPLGSGRGRTSGFIANGSVHGVVIECTAFVFSRGRLGDIRMGFRHGALGRSVGASTWSQAASVERLDRTGRSLQPRHRRHQNRCGADPRPPLSRRRASSCCWIERLHELDERVAAVEDHRGEQLGPRVRPRAQRAALAGRRSRRGPASVSRTRIAT